MASNPSDVHGAKIRFHHQNNKHYCGPACAMMILDAINVPSPDQKTLYKEIRAFPTKDKRRGHENWFSSPDGLQNVLDRRSRPRHNFTLYASLEQGDIARRLVNSISVYKAPCILLIYSGIHWIVVYQYRKRGPEPTRCDDFLLRDILGFYKRDPYEKVPSEGYVDYTNWLGDYRFPERKGKWKNKFIAICDPEPGKNKSNKDMLSKKKKALGEKSSGQVSLPDQTASDKQDNSQNQGKSAKPDTEIPDAKDPVSKEEDPEKPPITMNTKPGQDQNLMTMTTAKTYTMWHLKNDGFYDPAKFSRMINNPNSGRPVLVHNLDNDDFYYIVPILENNKQTSGLMRIAARNGKFQEAVFAMDINQPMPFKKLTDRKIIKLLIAKYGVSKIKKPVSIMPILVWKQCIQTGSRFMPFYKVKMRNKTVYVRMDGIIYSRLTKR